MEFCPNCSNYISINLKTENDKYTVIHNCKKCGYTADKTDTTTENSCMYNNPDNIDKLQYYIKHKENLRYDRTIPHIQIKKCPNKDCPSHKKDVNNDVLYINLDNDKLYILYICYHCSTHWTNQ